MNLGDVIERNERLYPGQVAVGFEGREITFATFAERIRRLANALHRRGLRRQDRIAVLSRNCGQYFEVFGAGELAGFITATVNYRLAPAEIEYVVNDSGAAVIVFEDIYAEAVKELRAKLPTVRHYLSIGASTEWAESYEDVLADSTIEVPSIRARDEDVAYLIYTSGTTGRPKGVMLGHHGQSLSAQNFCVEGTIDPSDRLLITTPVYHSGGKWMQIAYHWRGCPIYLTRTFDPVEALKMISEKRITTTLLPATMLQQVLDVPDFEGYDLSSLNTIYYSASPMPVPLLRRAIEAFGPIFIQHYGLTEAGGTGTSLLKNQHVTDGPERLVRRLASAGQEKTTCNVRVVRDDGVDCQTDEPGEVLFRNDSLMMGYWNNEQATHEAIVDGWLHSGDVGKFDDDRFVYVVDRKKDMIVSGGTNIYSREVEDALIKHTSVRDVAVIGIPDPKWGEAVHAFVVLEKDGEATERTLIDHCKTLIASFKKPNSIDFIDELPRLPNGKLNKIPLREPYWKDQIRRVN
jgi:acyl-CoA synthetase (AMP-forming)/AMP-acid ligase II